MINGHRIIAVLPAYNAERTLTQTVADIDRAIVDEVILVDDASRDRTVEVAKLLGLTVIVHPQNRGYGGNQKSCYAAAVAAGADIVVMVHPDHQYDPHYIDALTRPIAEGRADAVFGSRMITPGGAQRGGMPYWKYLGNIVLTKIANFVLGLRLSEYHSGFRAYSREVLTTLALEKNSDDFIFDTEIIVQLKRANFRITEIPITTRYFPEASSIGLRRSLMYAAGIGRVLWQYAWSRPAVQPEEARP